MKLLHTILLLSHMAGGFPAIAQATAFTYQGRLESEGRPADGLYDLRFTLHDASAGAVVGGPVTSEAVVVTQGLFTVALDFGPGVFNGSERWLEVGVRTNGVSAFSILTPRQPVGAAPQALSARHLSGVVSASQISGTLGTTDNQPFEVKVNNARAWRLEPAYDPTWISAAPNVIGGSPHNGVSDGVLGGFIGGGGNEFNRNRVEKNYASVVGGMASVAGGTYATAGGFASQALGSGATAFGFSSVATGSGAVALGSRASASNDFAVALGYEVRASGVRSVALGSQTTATGIGSTALGTGTLASGDAATAQGSASIASGHAATAMGFVTEASGTFATALGRATIASGSAATALGEQSTAAGNHSLAAGYRAKAHHHGSFVWADDIDAEFASTDMNQFVIRASSGVGIGTGSPRAHLHLYSGDNPTVMRLQSTGTPGFGRLEFVSNPQWDANEWRPAYIQSTDAGGFTGGLSFVVNGTGSDNKFAEIEAMRIQNGRVGIGNSAPSTLLQVGNATCNGSTWVNASDRNLKEDLARVNPQVVLEKVAALPLHEWTYKADAEGQRHLGPMAQDFHAAFGLGADDTHIATVDADGVALAAIQGLNEKVEGGAKDTERRMGQLEAENAALKSRLESMEKMLNHVLEISRHRSENQ